MRILLTLVSIICICLFALCWWLIVELFKTFIPVAILMSVLTLTVQVLFSWIVVGGFYTE